MTTMTTARINTTQRMVLYRDFIIQEAYVAGKGNVWEWTHEDFSHEATPQYLQLTGDCQTIFECIEAVDAWHAALGDEGDFKQAQAEEAA